MRMFSSTFDSSLANTLNTMAYLTDAIKTARDISKAHRGYWSRVRLFKDRLKGISAQQSYVTQFEENGGDYYQVGADLYNAILERVSLDGFTFSPITGDEYKEFHHLVYDDVKSIDVDKVMEWYSSRIVHDSSSVLHIHPVVKTSSEESYVN